MTTIMARMLFGAHSAMYTGPTMDARPMATPCRTTRQRLCALRAAAARGRAP